MATTYKTPGVYVEEIPKLPPSVAQVETAIPAFIGYTEKAEKNGESLINTPTRINSMVEFIQYYGGDLMPETINVSLDDENNYSVLEITIPAGERFYMYDSLRLFFDNGGGDCYIVSVGLFETTTAVAVGDENDPVNSRGLRVGLKALEKYDEPTIILFPDAGLLADAGEFYSLQQMAIAQCAKLQDRVCILDLRELTADSVNDAVVEFRNSIGINNLKYAGAYTPWLYTTYTRDVNYEQFASTVTDGDTPANPIPDLGVITSDTNLNALVRSVEDSIADIAVVQSNIDAVCDAANNGTIPANAIDPLEANNIKDRYKMFVDAMKEAVPANVDDRFNDMLAFVRNTAKRLQAMAFSNTNLTSDLNSYAASPSLWRGAVTDLIKIEKNPDVWALSGSANDAAVDALYTAAPAINITWLGAAVNTIGNAGGNGKNYDGNPPGPALTDLTLALIIEPDIKSAIDKLSLFADTIVGAANTYKKSVQDNLYNNHPIIGSIVKNIKKQLNILPPSGAIAGVYARVDNARGVWKAPANESINSVLEPVDQITAEEQSNLNVDAVAGKSINAIRAFTGKGTLVWGARTLAGNDNEWRYVSVRRFFNMVEESSKKSTEVFVFEPNDANTWVKVQGMLENFLTTLWRQGALQGAKPEHAFYVAVGLGKTMTALDILEGRMIVEIGMAVVRPAEFIILRFSHKMAES